MKTIVYQGVEGSFSYQSALQTFGKENHFQGLSTFREAFEAVASGKADFAVIPFENSIIGPLHENYELLKAFPLQIVGEDRAKIEHCLMVFPQPSSQKEARLKALKKVISHPKALDQCTHFFRDHPWIEAKIFVDTAAAAAEVATRKDLTLGAIAPAGAAKLYQLEILERAIQDNPLNFTRFFTLARI